MGCRMGLRPHRPQAMNAPVLYERCRPRMDDWKLQIALMFLGEPTYLFVEFDSYARHWNLEGPCGPEDRHE